MSLVVYNPDLGFFSPLNLSSLSLLSQTGGCAPPGARGRRRPSPAEPPARGGSPPRRGPSWQAAPLAPAARARGGGALAACGAPGSQECGPPRDGGPSLQRQGPSRRVALARGGGTARAPQRWIQLHPLSSSPDLAVWRASGGGAREAGSGGGMAREARSGGAAVGRDGGEPDPVGVRSETSVAAAGAAAPPSMGFAGPWTGSPGLPMDLFYFILVFFRFTEAGTKPPR